jgi:hypothetical protein
VPAALPRAKQEKDEARFIRSGLNRLRSSLLKRQIPCQREELLNEVRSLRMCDRKLVSNFWYAMESTATCDGGIGQHDDHPELPPHQQGKLTCCFQWCKAGAVTSEAALDIFCRHEIAIRPRLEQRHTFGSEP